MEFYVYKVPDDPCDNNLAWSQVDLADLPDDYLPRCKYQPAADEDEYLRRMDRLPWSGEASADSYRIAIREFVPIDSERTLTMGFIPKGFAHVHKVMSIAFRAARQLVLCGAVFSSLIADFFVRTLGKTNLQPAVLNSIPVPQVSEKEARKLEARILALNCLTVHYRELWEESFSPEFISDRWTSDDPHLNQDFFLRLTPCWQRDNALRSDLDRRQALIEIDVLTARAYGLSLQELEICYRLGFRVLSGYEEETYYDQNGRIVFTPNSQLGAGLPLKAKKNDDVVYTINGSVTPGPVGFADIRDMKNGTVTRTFTDSTLPGGPRRKTVTFVAPFFKKDRLADYRQAWAVFTQRSEEETQTQEARP